MEAKKRWIGGILLVLLILGSIGVSNRLFPSKVQKSENNKTIKTQCHLSVTQRFGKDGMIDKDCPISEGESVSSLLSAESKVDSAYDGSFVNGINGIQSKKKSIKNPSMDWFYFVNGTLSDVGAKDYSLKNQDSVWWDYHEWGGRSLTPAVIGSYPEPFLHGFRENHGVIIKSMVGEKREKQAAALGDALKKLGVMPIKTESLTDETILKKETPSILIGTWKELSGFQTICDLNEHPIQSGAFVRFSDSGMDLLNIKGETKTHIEKGFSIIATGEGMGDKSPIWLIVALNDAGVERAIQFMIHEPNQLKNRFGVVVSESGTVISLPVINEAGNQK